MEEKKGLTLLLCALLLTGVLISVQATEDYMCTSELVINGTGDFDRELKVQTELGYAGKTLEESYYTRYMGTDGVSNVQYDSALELYMGNSTEFEDKRVTEIYYAQTAFSSNARQDLCSSNYDVGAAHGLTTLGNTMKSFEVAMEDNVNEFEVEGSVSGRVKLMQKVVDPVDRTRYLDETTKLYGKFDFAWAARNEKISYPEGCGDWLGCP